MDEATVAKINLARREKGLKPLLAETMDQVAAEHPLRDNPSFDMVLHLSSCSFLSDPE